MDCKIFFYSEFPDIPDKYGREAEGDEGGNCKALCFKANAIIVKFVSKVCRCEVKWEKLEKHGFVISIKKTAALIYNTTLSRLIL